MLMLIFVIAYGLTFIGNWMIWYPSFCHLKNMANTFSDAKSWFEYISPKTKNSLIWSHPNNYIDWLNKFHKVVSSLPAIVILSLIISAFGPIPLAFAGWWFYTLYR